MLSEIRIEIQIDTDNLTCNSICNYFHNWNITDEMSLASDIHMTINTSHYSVKGWGYGYVLLGFEINRAYIHMCIHMNYWTLRFIALSRQPLFRHRGWGEYEAVGSNKMWWGLIGWDFGGISPNQVSDLILGHTLIIAHGLKKYPGQPPTVSPNSVAIAPHPPANPNPLHPTHGVSIAVYRIMYTYMYTYI